MRKCIYVDNLIEILNKEKVPFNADVNYFILNAPDADVQEVKHGIWVNMKFAISLTTHKDLQGGKYYGVHFAAI